MNQNQLKKKLSVTFPKFIFSVKTVIYDEANSE